MIVYLDASVLVPLFVDERVTANVREALRSLDERPALSEFAAGELASAFALMVRTGRLSAPRALDRLTAFDKWRGAQCAPCPIETDDLRFAGTLVRRFTIGPRMPEAVHLAVCARRGWTLMTGDARLVRASALTGVGAINPRPAPA